ncbi:MAG: hemolysin III family protein, partial [Oscillospiraceae bacterium]|nr:hemolysin III family protein [Oscillospiraceae bacterium]
GTLPIVTVTLFGVAMIQLYTVSCVYHALSPSLAGKKVMRVIDHCNVYLLVFGTYLPVALLGVGGREGRILLGIVALFTVLGIVLTAVDVDRFQVASVVCHLLSGWSILFGLPALLRTIGPAGMLYMVLGGVMYSVGAVLYGVGKSRRYRHSVFHVFCLLGTFCHFWAVYQYLL